ncbi:MAG: hypothetical protein JEZ06_05150 [Anaerolineaceae bacterium]|nr:hypothetical protein [Anaerolineaceae bacterium]
MKKLLSVFLIAFAIFLFIGLFVYFRSFSRMGSSGRDLKVIQWIRNPQSRGNWAVKGNQRCENAPFLMPTDGYIGYLWDDSFRVGHRHQGIDIFSGTEPGIIPVVAAYDGYLNRMGDWKSSLIIRIPQDPLQMDSQIWTYYTHLADEDGVSLISAEFPPGTQEVFVKAGTFLGYQGNYSGTPGNPVGVHLHFSIVQDDGTGKFKNELEIENTMDPSPYLQMNLNARTNEGDIPKCKE